MEGEEDVYLHIMVRLLSGLEQSFNVLTKATVDDLKRLIAERLGYLPCTQRLLLDDVWLTPGSRRIAELGVIDGSVVSLAIRSGKIGNELVDSDVPVGTTVKLISDEDEFKAAFRRTLYYRWDDGMRTILGTEQIVVDAGSHGCFGLEEAVRDSGFPVWYYPFSVVDMAFLPEVAMEGGEDEYLHIIVRLLSGLEETFNVPTKATVDDLKRLIAERLGHLPCTQRLLLDDVWLTPGSRSIAELGVIDGSIVSLAIRSGKIGNELVDSDVPVGTTVKLISDEDEFKAAFRRFLGYRWDDGMKSILGTEQIVVDAGSHGCFGLEEAVRDSGFPVWYYPFSVVEMAFPPDVAII